MKRGTDLKFKFRDLRAKLGMRDWQVKGILQSLWDFAAENAMAGDIGRFTNSQIALGIDFDGDADSLVEALVATRWIDKDKKHRLIIHDWHEHCEEWIKKRCSRAGITFCLPRGGQRQTTADSGRRPRQTTADNGSLPGPGPGPDPVPVPGPEPDPGPVESLRSPEAKGNPRQTRAGPEVSPGEFTGPDRTARAQRDKFHSLFAAKVCIALGLNEAGAQQQRRSLFAVARKIEGREDRDELAHQLIAIAASKRDAGLDKPIAAWQKEVNGMFEKG